MKIVILSQFPPQVGGIAVHCSQLAKGLESRGHKVHVITYGRMKRKTAGSVKIHEMPIVNKFLLRGSMYSYFTLKALKAINESEGIDIVHAHPLYPAGLVASVFKKKAGVPFVATCHGSDIMRWGRLGLARKLFMKIAGSTGRLICVSGHMAKEAKKLGVPKGRLEVVYDWIDRSIFPKEGKTALRKKLKLPEDRKLVVFAGALSEHKGPDILLDMAKGVDADFLFLGKGPMLKKLKDRARWKGIGNVRFLGAKTHRTCLKFMKAADLVAMPSRMEGFGMAALEAMAMGVPVLARPAGGLAEVVPKECLLDKKSLVKALENERFSAKLSALGREKARHFDMKKSVRRIEGIYREVVRGSNGKKKPAKA